MDSSQDPESLVKSSRIFEKIEVVKDFESKKHPFLTEVENDYLMDPEIFDKIEKFFSFAGPHMKELTIILVKVDPKFFQKLLNLLPNLEYLELDHVNTKASENNEPTKWALKSSKIKRIKMNNCAAEIGGLLGSLEKCVIEEAELDYTSSTETIQKFLKAQEKNLKKLTIITGLNVPKNLKNLRLEYLDFHHYDSNKISFKFLRSQTDLKVLKMLVAEFSKTNLSMICELKQLEILELRGSASDSSGLNNLHKLEKLKRLKVSKCVCRNILDHMKFGIFEDLEELDAAFEGASLESIQEIKRITPNLEKLGIQYTPLDTINALLETLENLEILEI